MTTKPRGRPRSFDPDVALAQASETFRKSGFAATSLDDIAHATGLNRPSLYAAFGDKKAMYLAALAHLAENLDARAKALGNAGLPLRETLRLLFAASIDSYLGGESGTRGCLAINTASVEAAGDPDIHAALHRVLAVIDDHVADWFRRAGHPMPERQARLVASVMHCLSVRARAGQQRSVLEEIAADTIDLVAPAAD